jgi:integrase
VDFLIAHGTTPVDVPVTMGVQQRIPGRLLAIPVPQEVMDQRRGGCMLIRRPPSRMPAGFWATAGDAEVRRVALCLEMRAGLSLWANAAALCALCGCPNLPRMKAPGGSLAATGMSVQAIRERVQRLGQAVGVPNLSPHDLRHTWATRAQRGGTAAFVLRDAGGWSSLAMPNRYAHAAAIANDEVTLAD